MPERYRQVGNYYEVEKEVLKLNPRRRSLTSTLEQMFLEEALPAVGEKKEWVELEAWPKFVQDFEGDFTVECYVAKFLMLRNHLGRVWEAVGATGMRYNEECRRVKQVLLVITPNTMVYFARGSNAFQYLGPKVGYSANLCDAEYPSISTVSLRSRRTCCMRGWSGWRWKVRRRLMKRRRRRKRGGTLTGTSRTCC